MIYIRPDYYDAFHCTADKCRHSCCAGWEIDIDEESLRRYGEVTGWLGEKLRRSICTENDAHFVLDRDGRCPFLQKNGLCELIIELGEDSLCDICTEHPRFYNEYGDVFEEGLGMCCEEASRLLLEGNESVKLIVETDGGEENLIPPSLMLRGEIFECLERADISFEEKEREALSLVGTTPVNFRAGEAARFCLSLERMEKSWGDMLLAMARFGDEADISGRINDVRCERICEYFIFRHFACAKDRAEARKRLKFCFFASRFVCCMEALGYENDALRLFSAETEYSDENLAMLIEFVGGENDDGRENNA